MCGVSLYTVVSEKLGTMLYQGINSDEVKKGVIVS